VTGRASVSEVSGDASHDPEHDDESNEDTDGDAHEPAQTVGRTAPSAPTGDALGELPDADHAHRAGPSPGLDPPAALAPHRRQAPRRRPALALFAVTVPARRHRQK